MAPPRPTPPPRAPRRGLGRLALAAAVLGVALGTTLGWQWWQERPLRAAEMELARGNAPRALALAEYFLDLHPGSGRAEAARARALVSLGKGAEASAIYERIGAATADDLVAWARSFMLREQWSRAAAILEQVLRVRPDDADALYELGTCRTRLGRFDDAAEAATRFAALPGQQARGDVLLGAIRADAGDPETAAAAYARAFALAPDGEGLQIPPEEFLVQYATILMNLGRTEDAMPLLEKSLASTPTPAAHHLLGKAVAREGDESAAETHWLAAIELDPAAVSPREDLVGAALNRGDTEAARTWIAPLARIADARFQTAYLFQRLAAAEKDDEAFARWKAVADRLRVAEDRVKTLELGMAKSPDAYWSRVVRAHKFASLGNWDQARDLVESVPKESDEPAFVAALREALRTRGTLPSLDLVPLDTH